MFRALVILASVLGASAFMPKATPAVRSAAKAVGLDAPPAPPAPPAWNPKNEPGVSGPFGFFDPISLCPENAKDFSKFRESELKHGRIAMVAFLGFLFAESGLNFFGSEITGPAIYQYQQAETFFNAWSFNVVGFCLAVEGYNIVNGWDSPSETMSTNDAVAGLKVGYMNGDLKFDPLGLKPKTPAALKAMQTKELNNGRLAMLAVAGLIAQELVTNSIVF
jgi:Chlorophyll A-B binding protein